MLTFFNDVCVKFFEVDDNSISLNFNICESTEDSKKLLNELNVSDAIENFKDIINFIQFDNSDVNDLDNITNVLQNINSNAKIAVKFKEDVDNSEVNEKFKLLPFLPNFIQVKDKLFKVLDINVWKNWDTKDNNFFVINKI